MSGPSSRYIEVPAEALLAELRSIGDAVVARGGKFEESVQYDRKARLSGREIVYEITPPNRPAPAPCVRIFTSLARGADAVRACGEDAVRIVIGTHVPTELKSDVFRALDKSRRIYRTAPAGNDDERVKAFLGRLRQALRDAYVAALKVPMCPACKAPMARRKTKGGGTEFFGCIRFPECRGTRPLEGA